jgi:DNA-entry nuclease
MTKKILALLLAVMMLTSLVACGSNSNDTPSTKPNVDTSTTAPSTETLPDVTEPGTSDSTTAPTDPSDPTTDTTVQDPNKVTVENLKHTLFNGTDAYIIVNNGIPFFTEEEKTTKSFETYAELDSLGRCGVTYACVGKDLMPTEDRESISSVYPSGWKYNGKSNNKQYDFVDGKYLYNRCHLIGFQLTGENANEKNLITGTRFLNINGMLTFENMIADAVREDDLHVLYRVTPIYDGTNLVAEGVLMEGYSVEDNGAGIMFCVYCYNVQPQIYIDYKTGASALASAAPSVSQESNTSAVYRTPSGKRYHLDADCGGKNSYQTTLREATAAGLTPCAKCAK